MSNWMIKNRMALKSALGVFSKLAGGLVRHTDRLPIPASGSDRRRLFPRKATYQPALAVENGLKEFLASRRLLRPQINTDRHR
jgi:hypothetical protein